MPSGLRRASIVAAALPLLRRHGVAVTTAQIATAAGVAEGTLFRIFPDKEALIAATVQAAFDPAPAEAQLRAIDRRRSLRDQMVAAVEVLQRRVEQVWQLISILGMSGPPKRSGPAAGRGRGPAGAPDAVMRAQLVAIFEPHRAQLRCKPAHAARLLRLMTFAGTHPRITENQPLAAAEVVDILLDGIRARKEEEST
jgi:AcrR family transcriptional regulator